MLSNAHAPDQDTGPRAVNHLSKATHRRLARATVALQQLPVLPSECGPQLIPAGGMRGDKAVVHPVLLDQILQRTVEEGDVAASADLIELIHHPGAHKGTLR